MIAKTIQTKDKRQWDRCRSCGRNWDQTTHSSQAQCRGCRSQNKSFDLNILPVYLSFFSTLDISLQSLALCQETLDKKGYDINDLSRGSVQDVIHKCDVCGLSKETPFKLFVQKKNLSHLECKTKKTIVTNMTKYGVPYAVNKDPEHNKKEWQKQSVEILKKRQQTNLEKYGVTNVLLQEHIREANGTAHPYYTKEEWLIKDLWGCRVALDQDLPEKWTQSTHCPIQVVCTCGNKWCPDFSYLVQGKTRSCGHNTHTSFAEQEIGDYIESTGIQIKRRTKIGGLEADIFIPSKQIAIEYNGLAWHNERMAHNKYKDYRKYKVFEAHGTRYVGIFEDEWIENKELIKKYLQSILGLKKPIYNLRPQEVCVVYMTKKSKLLVNFLNNYHYAGGQTTLRHIWEVWHNESLIGVLGIGKPTRQTIKEPFELKRICLHPDYHVPGLWSFLLKRYVSKTIKGVITSFSDNRRDTGNLYEILGFEKVGKVRPDYYWTKGQRRFHKSAFKKNDAIRQTGMTEKEYWVSQGYNRIFDCGKTKWNLILSDESIKSP